MSTGRRTRAEVLAKALGVAALLGLSNLIRGRGRRLTNDGHPSMMRGCPSDDAAHSRRVDLMTYAIGYVLALVLTCLAFALVYWQLATARTTLGIVLGFALIQVIVHFRCFLHIDLKRSSRDDLQLILFSTLIVLLMVGGTLIVLFNLKKRMM